MQPIKPGDALTLDKMIASKIHLITGFPYNPNTEILTLPVELHGLEFLSLAQINSGIAIDGLWHDINHHVPAYRNIARVMLADWMCNINHCMSLLDVKGLLRDFTSHYRRLPTAWIITHNAMTMLEPTLSLRRTNCSFIQCGEVLISHVLNIAKAHGVEIPDGRALKTLSSHGVVHLADAGLWLSANGIVYKFESHVNLPNAANWMARSRDNWAKVPSSLTH